MVDEPPNTQLIPEIPEPDLQSTPLWAANNGAKEEKYWDELDKVREKNDIIWLTVYGKILVAITTIFAGLFLVSLCFWAYHHLAPKCWTWLTPDQLSKVQSVLFSGGMGAIVSSVVQKQIAKDTRR